MIDIIFRLTARILKIPGRMMILMIRAYQVLIAPFIPQVCRFEPTCSCYSVESIQKFGVIKGGALSMWRILRCNPFSVGGMDPVP